jgi:hypothetical protein
MASMTYLAIAQLAHRILRMGNQAPGTQPTTIPPPANTDQVLFDIADTVPRAFESIQDEHPSWNWMRSQGTFILQSGTRSYSQGAVAAGGGAQNYYGLIPFWAPNYPRPYLTIYDSGAVGSSIVDYLLVFTEYIDWRGFWDRLPRPAATLPQRITERPDKTLEFDPTPALAPSGSNWAIRFDFRRANQVLANGSDVPILPAEFHEMIAYKTVMLVAEMRQNQGPGIAYAASNYQILMDRMKARYLPQVQIDIQYA